VYHAVILDIDGTLVDSNDGHAHAWVDALTERGRRVSFERVRPLIGMGTDKLLAALDASLDSSETADLSRRRAEIFEDRYLPAVKPTRGAHALLEWFRDERLTLVVATSADWGELHALLARATATRLVEHVSASGGSARSKPDPDVVRAALDRTGWPASEVVMLGDTPYDVEAAQGAGVGLIAVRCGGWTDAALAGAIAIYDDPQDLLDHYDVSPFKRPLPIRSE